MYVCLRIDVYVYVCIYICTSHGAHVHVHGACACMCMHGRRGGSVWEHVWLGVLHLSVCGLHVCTCRCVREIDMGMDMHTGILYVHTHVNWSVKGARDAEARKGLCAWMRSLCVHLFVFVCVGFCVCLPQANVEL